MGSFIKKDLLVFWRDRKEILAALLLPIALIVILNFAFSGIFNDDQASINLDVAIVQDDDPSAGLERFKETIQEGDFSQAEKATMIEQAASIEPSRLIHDFFNNKGLKEWVNTKELPEKEAKELVDNGELDAIIKIPKGFTYHVSSAIMLNKESEVALTIMAEDQSAEVRALQNIVNSFIDSLNLQFALGSKAESAATEPELPQGGKEVVEGVDTYTISQYFTIAISTLFALFMAQTVALKTVTEKRERVFNRIVLSDSNPLYFLLGKTVSTFILTLLQMVIVFASLQLLLDIFPGKPFAFWLGLMVVMTAFALTVAGLSALFTAMTLNLTNSNAVSGLSTLIIMTLGVLGGSFFPIQGFPEIIQKMGEWTPNGLTQTVLIEWIQFGNADDLLLPIIILIAVFVVCFGIGMSIFPKRGRI
ncbi:ABC transporter permease [Virgibacillus dakarensis]|nr:ABC transporter permease [Virgibacillus dakarensis]